MGGKYLSLVIVQAGQFECIRDGLLGSSVLFAPGVPLTLECTRPGSAAPNSVKMRPPCLGGPSVNREQGAGEVGRFRLTQAVLAKVEGT